MGALRWDGHGGKRLVEGTMYGKTNLGPEDLFSCPFPDLVGVIELLIKNAARRPRWIPPSFVLSFVFWHRMLTLILSYWLYGLWFLFNVVSFPFVFIFLTQSNPLYGDWDLTSVWYGRLWRDRVFSFAPWPLDSQTDWHKSFEICVSPLFGLGWFGVLLFPSPPCSLGFLALLFSPVIT